MNLNPILSLSFSLTQISRLPLMLQFGTQVKYVPMEGTMSRILYLGLSFHLSKKERVTFGHFLKPNVLDSIKYKLKHK